MSLVLLFGGVLGIIIGVFINLVYDIFVRRIEFRRAYSLEIIRQKNKAYELIIQGLLIVQDLLSWCQYEHGIEKILDARQKWDHLFDIVIPRAALYIEPDIRIKLEKIKTEMETDRWGLSEGVGKTLFDRLKKFNDQFIDDMNRRINDIGKIKLHRGQTNKKNDGVKIGVVEKGKL